MMADIIGPWVEPKGVLLADLQEWWRHRHNHHTTTSTDTHAAFTTSNGRAILDRATKSLCLNNDQGEKVISAENPKALEDLDVNVVDADIAKVLNAFINARDNEIEAHDLNSSGEREHDETDCTDEYCDEEEVVELEFERAIKKLDKHTMHCPKCNTQVTKVILSRKRKLIAPKQRKALNLLGCLPCLSVFIPNGNCINMFGLLGNQTKKPQQTPELDESISTLEENASPSIISSDNGNVLIREKVGCFGLFWIFLNKKDKESTENLQQTSAVNVKGDSPSDPTNVNGVKVIEQVKDQEEHLKGKVVAATEKSSYYPYAQLRKYFRFQPPQEAILQPGEVRLDIRDDSDHENELETKLLAGQHTETEEQQSAVAEKLEGQKEEWTISGAHPGALEDLDVKLVDADIGKVLNAFINAQDDEIKTHDPESSGESGNEEINSTEEYEEEEVLELEFERAIKKLDTHTMDCPKCNNQVTKVILRRKRRVVVPKQHKPLYLLGCLPCLSVFVPIGNCFNMFKLFGNEAKKPEQTPALDETINYPLQENISPSIIPSGDVVIQEKAGGCLGLFWVFRNKEDKYGIENPQQTPAVDISHCPPILDSTHVIDNKVTEEDQVQHSKGKDVAATDDHSFYVPYAQLHGKFYDLDRDHPPLGVILPGDVRLDILADSYAKLLPKPAREIEENQSAPPPKQEGDYGSGDGGALLGQHTGPHVELRTNLSNDQGSKSIEIVKSIVYGGLMESIASLSIVASDAKLLPKPAREIEENQSAPPPKQEGDYGSRDGGALLGQHTGPHVELRTNLSNDQGSKSTEIVKSIVYGGLMESIASLSIVASAAASDATTLNIVALGLASHIGGLSIIAHNLWDLKDDQLAYPQATKYQELLGQRVNFPLHPTVAILSFLLFGFVSPITYGFSFRASDNRDYKILAVAAASLLCVILLAIGKAYVQKTPSKFSFFMKTIMYYVTITLTASGVSYVAGHLIKKVIEEYGLFDTGSPPTLTLPGMNSVLSSY